MKKFLSIFWNIIKKSFRDWKKHKANLLAAALAYYTLFSLAPILLITIFVAGTIIGEDTVKHEIILKIRNTIGFDSAEAVKILIDRIRQPIQGIFTSILGALILFYASTNVFNNLKRALNLIWGIEIKNRHWLLEQFFNRIWSFVMILILGFLLMVSVIFDAGLVSFGDFVNQYISNKTLIYFGQAINFVFAVVLVTLIFAAIFKILPDAKVAWHDVWLGAVLTSFLFNIGKFLIAIYLGNSQINTLFGGASSFIVIMIWVYYSSQVLLLGAEFTQHYAYECGSYSQNKQQC